jgi:hypothetical protein
VRIPDRWESLLPGKGGNNRLSKPPRSGSPENDRLAYEAIV